MKKIILLIIPFLLFAEEKNLSSVLIADGYKKPVFITSYPNNAKLLYIVEQAGLIKLINDGKKLSRPFFDINKRVVNPNRPGDERGLLGFAFHPNHTNNGKFYINYMDNDGNTIVSEFSTNSELRANHKSERIILKLKQPYGNHNGGDIQFGPDGYLYISIGDGGKAGDPLNAGQDLSSLFGKIIRIDIEQKPYGIPKSNPFFGQKGKREEIWAWGLRNVWRFSFDKQTGDKYLADVGQNKWEEVNFEPASSEGGLNYGWRIMEANHCYDPKENCPTEGLIKPIIEYPNDANHPAFAFRIIEELSFSETDVEGCSVTGGYVYRGQKIKSMQGQYIFGDYCSGNIWTLKVVNGKAINFKNRTEEINIGGGEFTTYISSFGQDSDGEIYIIDYNGGIYKLIESD
ncbi:MAG: PQQ-dependent sugar dehydrogenase [Candidatus Neomarinimicrobiota bacterium]|nr:PQQ-dependent sugar dehydrogenase [Candidatus Neomarinimicrobiota bacterium]